MFSKVVSVSVRKSCRAFEYKKARTHKLERKTEVIMAGTLGVYNQKRNFTRTPEPHGKKASAGKKLSFVVQHHIASRDHYDFRLEWNGVLLSWAVPKGPSFDTHDRRLAVRVEDHPLDYRNFEGTIPKGEYGGGTVMLWDEGTWEPYVDVEEGLKEGSLKFILNGKRLEGKWTLVRMKPKEGEKEDGENWLLIKEKDAYAGEGDGISDFDTSIRTGRTMEKIANDGKAKEMKNPFSFTEVQLAKLADKIPEDDGWIFELKYDGYRILTCAEGGKATLFSRNGKDYTEKFEAVSASLKNLRVSALL